MDDIARYPGTAHGAPADARRGFFRELRRRPALTLAAACAAWGLFTMQPAAAATDVVQAAPLLEAAHSLHDMPAPPEPAPAHAPHHDAHSCTATGRPAIGLVLSGGGARGYAHLGVLKVLAAHRIPIDCIAATSMGAVVGGLYASGMRADDMIDRLANVDLADVAFDVARRQDLPQKQREDDERYVGGLTLGFDRDGIRRPVGLVQGNRLQALLADWTAEVPATRSFDRLPIPFRAVATNLRNGHKVVLDHGSLPLAIRASMAMPGLFSPTELDGRTLVDGGLVDNLPVDTVREMGADVVIAVDVGSQLRPLDALTSPADVVQQMMAILIRQNVTPQRDAIGARDVLLEPALGALNFSDFRNAKQAIAAGEAAAEAALPRLEPYALTPQAYAAHRTAHQRATEPPVRLANIEIRTRGPVPKRVVADALHVKPGDVYDAAAVNHDLQALVANRDFDSVTQQLVPDDTDDANTLRIDATSRDWGPNFLLFGLGMSSDSSNEGGFRFRVGYRRPWLTDSGLEFRGDATLGSDLQRLYVELRQPLTQPYGVYLAPHAEFERRFENQYVGSYRVPDARLQTQSIGLDLGVPIGRLGDFRVGLVDSHTSLSAGTPILFVTPDGALDAVYPNASEHVLSARAQLQIDQLDDPQLPRQGYAFRMRAEKSLQASQQARYTEVDGKAVLAWDAGRHSLGATVEGGKLFGNDVAINAFAFTLGGFQRLAAYSIDALSGSAYAFGQLTYMNRLSLFNGVLPIKAFYLGASVELGNIWPGGGLTPAGSLKQSYTLFSAFSTSIGPIYVGVAVAPHGQRNVYLQLGRTY